jgi:chromosome segregation ATPase
MAEDEPISTSDALIELRQARRTFEVFANAEKVCEYLLSVEQRQRDAEQKLADLEASGLKVAEQIAERTRTAELRAEEIEQRAADTERQIADDQAKAEQSIADAKAKLAKDVEAAQQKIKDAKAELADLKKKIADAKKTLEGTK